MPDGSLNDRGIASLIEPGRVHRRVYTDPAGFELEMQRLFGRPSVPYTHLSLPANTTVEKQVFVVILKK